MLGEVAQGDPPLHCSGGITEAPTLQIIIITTKKTDIAPEITTAGNSYTAPPIKQTFILLIESYFHAYMS